MSPVRPRDGVARDVGEGGDVGGGEGEGVGEVRGGWKGSWMTISLVKSSSTRGVGGSGGWLRASATLLDSPATCLMSQVNWLMNRRWRSACKDQVEVECALVRELVKGFVISVYNHLPPFDEVLELPDRGGDGQELPFEGGGLTPISLRRIPYIRP